MRLNTYGCGPSIRMDELESHPPNVRVASGSAIRRCLLNVRFAAESRPKRFVTACRTSANSGLTRRSTGCLRESCIDLLVECVDDLGGRVPGCADARPSARLIPGEELADGRKVW